MEGGLLASFAGQASALDAIMTNSSGSICVPTDGKLTGEWNFSPKTGIGRNCSSCSGTSNVVCSLSYPQTFSLNNRGVFNAVTVNLVDNSPTSNVTCTLYAVDGFGNVVFSESHSSTGTGITNLGYFPNLSEFQFTSASVQCSVPARTSTGVSRIENFELAVNAAQ
jgi:hypothetical protein